MNYLAHLYLADPTPESLIGNLLGDFVKGRLGPPGDDDAISRGILLHRKIDAFSNVHPRACCSRNRISSARRRFAGIIIDIFFDHLLARHWNEYSNVELSVFVANVYRVLWERRAILPQRLNAMLVPMIKEDWLQGYQDLDNVALSLDRVALRLKRRNSLRGSIDEVKSNYEQLEKDFLAFFPDLIRYSEACKLEFAKPLQTNCGVRTV